MYFNVFKTTFVVVNYLRFTSYLQFFTAQKYETTKYCVTIITLEATRASNIFRNYNKTIIYDMISYEDVEIVKVKKFNLETDLEKLENYLRNQYIENRNMTSWLPERLHDLIYRMDTQYLNAGKLKSSDYIFFWEDNNEIVGCILPDGDAIYMSIKKGYENLYKSIVKYAEENCKPLFKKMMMDLLIF